MSSPLGTVLGDIVTTVEALTPPSSTEITYSEVDDVRGGIDSSDHRTFSFSLPSRGDIIAERGTALAEYEWRLDLGLTLLGVGRSARDHVAAVADEVVLICRAIDKKTDWAGNVTFAQVDAVSVAALNEETRATLVAFHLRVTTEETD